MTSMTTKDTAMSAIEADIAWLDEVRTGKHPDVTLHSGTAVIRLERILALARQCEGLREALINCRDKFAEYAALHMAKLPPDYLNAPGDWRDIVAKAKRNDEMAAMCDASLATLPEEVGNG